LIIQCTNCKTRYHYDEKRFGSAAVKRIRCTKCQTIFEIRNLALTAAPVTDGEPEEIAPLHSPILRAGDFSLDVTAMGGGPHKRAAASVPPATAPANRTGSYQTPGGTGPGTEGKRLKLPDWERLSLACTAGPDAGKIFEIDKPRVVIGRADADILLSDSECSRQHAAIEVAEEEAMLIDLGSTNGTYVGERPIQEFQLESRNEFDVGASTLMFIRSRKGSEGVK